jgi:hypothetical protein
MIAILILLFFHRYCSSWNILSSKRYIYIQDMYIDYANKICTGTKKSIVTLSLEEEVCLILLGLLSRFLFFDN